MRDIEPYTRLAACYDAVMDHVDYDEWAGYVHRLLRAYVPSALDVLELACGTGSLAVRLQPMGGYTYTATDASESMLAVARRKAGCAGTPVAFARQDFTALEADSVADAVLLLYDGINYVLDEVGLRRVFSGVFRALRPGGVFIFDVSTPANSINNEEWFEDEGATPDCHFRRHSVYDAATRLHETTIVLTTSGEEVQERHRERAYEAAEVRPLLASSGFRIVSALDGFTMNPSLPASERIHWVACRPGG